MTKEERMKLHELVPELTEGFKDFVRDCFEGYHTMFYSRPDGDIQIECCHCNMIARYRSGKTSKDFMPAWGDNPKPESGGRMICPNCGEEVTLYRKANRKHPIEVSGDFWYGQKMKGGGYVLRFFRSVLCSYPDDDGSYEEIRSGEKMRIFFPIGWEKKTYKEYRHDWFSDGGNMYGGWDSSSCFSTMSYYYQGPTTGEIYPETYDNMIGTPLEYSMSREAMDDPMFLNVTIGEWQQAYITHKWYESLYKMGLGKIIENKFHSYSHIKYNGRAKNVWDYLKIYKPRLKDLIRTKDSDMMMMLEAFRAERAAGEHWDDTTVNLCRIGFSEEDLRYIRQFTTAKKLTNYFEKLKKRYNITGSRITYMDYLRMTERCGYDMTDSINLFPKNLADAHDNRVNEVNAQKAEERKKEVERIYGAIRTRFKKADETYHYEKGSYLIRPAKNASEIVDEGRTLHHCVGNDSYLKSHAEKKSIICFLRTIKEPDKPFITVQIQPDGEISQWYGIHDSKPNEKKIDRWLGGYIKTLDLEQLRREAKRRNKKAV